MTSETHTFMTTEALLEHWQGHQRLTRRTLEAFPEEHLFSFTPAAPMRPFGVLVLELIGMVEPTLEAFITNSWETPDMEAAQAQRPSKAELLIKWDETSKLLSEQWPRVPLERFGEVVKAFGWTQPGANFVLYLIDNEIHHRAQGYVYVYLRLLGLEPPAFYER